MSLDGEDKKKRSLVRSLSLNTFGDFELFNYLCVLFLMEYLAHRHIAEILIVRAVTAAVHCWLNCNLGHCATCFLE